MITRQSKKKVTSSTCSLPRARPLISDTNKRLCEKCKGVISYDKTSDTMLAMKKVNEEIKISIENFEKSISLLNSRAEMSLKNLESLKTDTISKLESLEVNIDNKFVAMEDRINEIKESLYSFRVKNINNENVLPNTIHCNTKVNTSVNNSILIYGDSNTKHINLSNNFTECHRIPTYRICDIDVNKCIGYKTMWIHCGINDLKRKVCRNDADIHRVFKVLMAKLNRIKTINPRARVILSPVLPTGITALTERASYFNSLIFAIKNHWWLELKFSSFLNSNGNLDSIFRCRNNPSDRIHLGYHGINALTGKIKLAIARTDTRTYASVVRGPPYRYNASS